MSKSITSDNGVEITVGLLALEVTDPVSAIGVYARLSPGQRCALADALRGREPGDEYVDWKAMYEQAVQERDALNTRHPKPQPYDQGGVRGADSLLYRAERERDAAVARAEQAEQLIPAYAMLDIWMALGRDSIHFDDWYDKHGYADAWAELTAAVREAAEARTVPAVTRDEIGNALMRVGVSNGVETHTEVSVGTDAVWSLVSGDDPAVHVVRESELPHTEDDYLRNFDLSDGRGKYRNATDDEIREAREMAEFDLRWLIAVQQHIEAEQAVDPVAEKARELYRAATPDARWETVADEYRRIARHVLGQEASNDE